MNHIPQDLLRGWTVVVLDDDPDSLELVSTILTAYDANVYTASNGQAGLALLREVKPDFVISDLSMPVMDGWAFADALKKNRGLAEIPVIALTAHAMQGDRERAIATGFHNYLTKPLTIATFMSDLMKLLVDIPTLSRNLKL